MVTAGYSYVGSIDEYNSDYCHFLYQKYTKLNLPEDSYRIFSYCAESRSNALGAIERNVGNFDEKFLLRSRSLKYDRQHYSHSRQFRSTIVDEKPYWLKVIEKAILPIIPQEGQK